MIQKMRLGDLLVESNLITEQQLNSALVVQRTSGGSKLGEILVDLEIITEEQLFDVLQKKLNIPFVKLEAVDVTEQLLGSLPEDIAREKIVFPYRIQGNTLYIATSDPLDYQTLNQVSVATGKNVEAVISSKKDIHATIDRYYRKHTIDNMATVLNQATTGRKVELLNEITFDEVENRLGSVPVVKFINNLVMQAYNKRASDIHIEALEDAVRVRFRIDGELLEIVRMSLKTHASIVTRIKIMADMDIAEKRIPLDGRFNLSLEGSDVSVRVASMPTVYGEKIVLRLMADTRAGILPLESLGVNKENVKKIRQVIANPNGLILMTGPTGSGKSTTLYSLLNEMATANTNILTVEDPVEKIVKGINQTQVNNRAGLTFATGLRAILRQDPDKIMIGEIRDTETADIAARAAITGHLVLASLHTNDAASAYMRLVDMGIEPYVIASSVIAVLAQRLVKLICPHCKEEYTPTDVDMSFYDRFGAEMPQVLYKGRGCEKCEYTGNLGRTAVHEIILTDQTLRTMIMEKAKASDIEEYLSREKNQKYLVDDALERIRDGKVFVRELINLSRMSY